VARRLALVELLPEAVQQLVRDGRIAAQIAMRSLAPVVRIDPEHCRRMAEAFAARLGFRFQAHEIGDANRSARVERPFPFIENNFLAGRTFADWRDLNEQARQWCDRVNATYKKHIRAVPRELYAVERPHLKPLAAWIPEVYRLHHRMVDVEGYVSLHSNRYSVPPSFIGRRAARVPVSEIRIRKKAPSSPPRPSSRRMWRT